MNNKASKRKGIIKLLKGKNRNKDLRTHLGIELESSQTEGGEINTLNSWGA